MRNERWVDQGKKLRDMRSRLKLSREEVCQALDISVSTLSNVEIGCQNVGKKTLKKLIRLYSADPGFVSRTLSSSRQRGISEAAVVPQEADFLLPDDRVIWLDHIARIVAAPEFIRKLEKMVDLLEIDRVDACYSLIQAELRKIRKTPIWGLTYVGRPGILPRIQENLRRAERDEPEAKHRRRWRRRCLIS